MDARMKMVEFRRTNGLLPIDAARKYDISLQLLHEIEAGGVTHPKIARRIQLVCGLSDEETEELVPECRRKDVNDPDRYKTIPGQVYTTIGYDENVPFFIQRARV